MKFTLNLNGSSSIKFFPFGKITKVNMKSSWSDPSFIGSFLPNKRDINSTGFSAEWKVINLNRNYPQKFRNIEIPSILVNNKNNFSFTNKSNFKESHDSSFGTKLIIPVNYYQKSQRSIKYGLLIIILTFALFFFIEIFTKKRIHSIQYVFIGVGLILFFTILISFSEHIGFMWAYIIASLSTIGLIVFYSFLIFKNQKYSYILLILMSSYYSLIYILIHLQDYSLLIGSVMLFSILAVIMYISRNIDWYNINKIEK